MGWEQYKESLRVAGVIRAGTFEIRHVRNASVGKLRRTEAQVVLLNPSAEISDEHFDQVVRAAIRVLQRQLIRGQGLQGPEGLPMPPSYVWLRVHRTDARARDLLARGWKDQNLLARVEWCAPWAKPIYVPQAARLIGRVRVQPNPGFSRP